MKTSIEAVDHIYRLVAEVATDDALEAIYQEFHSIGLRSPDQEKHLVAQIKAAAKKEDADVRN